MWHDRELPLKKLIQYKFCMYNTIVIRIENNVENQADQDNHHSAEFIGESLEGGGIIIGGVGKSCGSVGGSRVGS